MRYLVELGGRQVEVEVDGDRVTVGGEMFVATLSAVAGTPLRQLLIGDRRRTLAVEPVARGRWRLGADGESLEVEVTDERARHLRALTGATRQARGGVLKAPMPGLVVRVRVEPGQEVPAGGGVLVLEAMKMENELRAAAAGVVRAIHVKPGQTVEKGQVLAEFD
ncbi:MAG TPA: biotin/lipoyl-containing protein [Gemmatimonadales bacterium]|nr:biotin/lipoyl-containing protein [Gemmatimonadales bacterium]